MRGLCLRGSLLCLFALGAFWSSAAEDGGTGKVSSAVFKADETRSNWTGQLRALPTNDVSNVVAVLAYSDEAGARKYDLYAADLVLAEKIRELAAHRARVVLHGVLRPEGTAIAVDACREVPKKDKRKERDRTLPF